MNIGRAIKQARNAAGLTQDQLGEKAGYSAVAIRQWERGTRHPKTNTLERLASVLGVTVSYFMDEAEAPAPATRSAQREKVCSLLVAQMELIAEKSRDDRGVLEEDLARLSDSMSILAQSLLNWEGGEGAE